MLAMLCIACGAKTAAGTTVDVTELENCLVIVRGVPCHKCTECSEISYTGDVTECLEEIVKLAQHTVSGIAIMEYNDRVA